MDVGILLDDISLCNQTNNKNGDSSVRVYSPSPSHEAPFRRRITQAITLKTKSTKKEKKKTVQIAKGKRFLRIRNAHSKGLCVVKNRWRNIYKHMWSTVLRVFQIFHVEEREIENINLAFVVP